LSKGSERIKANLFTGEGEKAFGNSTKGENLLKRSRGGGGNNPVREVKWGRDGASRVIPVSTGQSCKPHLMRKGRRQGVLESRDTGRHRLGSPKVQKSSQKKGMKLGEKDYT